MTFVSKTALTGGMAAFPASMFDLEVSFPEGELVESPRLGLPAEGGDGSRRALRKLLQIFLLIN